MTFSSLFSRGRPEAKNLKVSQFISPPVSFKAQALKNPYQGSRAQSVLREMEKRLINLDNGVIVSFLYDLHRIVMINMSRNLEFTVVVVESAPCLQVSPLVLKDHVKGPALIVRVFDHFTGCVTHTAVCSKHWGYMSEGDVDLLHSSPWTHLVVA